MSAWSDCRDGNCNPYSCPICMNACDACSRWLIECICPQLPIDTEDQP